MTIKPPPVTPGVAHAFRLWNAVGGQLREYHTREDKKALDENGRETGAVTTTRQVRRVLDLTPLLLMLLLPAKKLRVVEDVLTIHRGMGGEVVHGKLPAWVRKREERDPLWLERLAYEIGVVGAEDPDAGELEAEESPAGEEEEGLA